MTLFFKYTRVNRPDGTEVKTPSIPVLLCGDETFDTVALVDSGADISALPERLAHILGLDLSGKRSPAYGIGGKVEAVDTSMGIVVERGHERYGFTIPVKVILGNYDFPVLLGKAGFFEKFIISFDQIRERVLLKRQHTTIS